MRLRANESVNSRFRLDKRIYALFLFCLVFNNIHAKLLVYCAFAVR